MRRTLNVRRGAAVLWTAAALTWASPASAQGADPNPGALTLTANIDFVNAYIITAIVNFWTG